MTARIVNVSLTDTFALPGTSIGTMAQLWRASNEWLCATLAPVSTSGTAAGLLVSLSSADQAARVVPAPTVGALLRLWLPPNHGLWASRSPDPTSTFVTPPTGTTLACMILTSVPLAGQRLGAASPLAKTLTLSAVAAQIVPASNGWRSVTMTTPTTGAVTWFGFAADEPTAGSRGMPVPDSNTQPLEFLLPPGVAVWALTDTAGAEVTVLATPLMEWAVPKPIALPPRWL